MHFSISDRNIFFAMKKGNLFLICSLYFYISDFGLSTGFLLIQSYCDDLCTNRQSQEKDSLEKDKEGLNQVSLRQMKRNADN